MKKHPPALSGPQGVDDCRETSCRAEDVSHLPVLDDFLSRLDGKLSRRNEEISQKLAAWGDLLDLAGWCVGLELGGETPWLNRPAERHLEQLEKTAATWQDLLGILEKLPDETLQRRNAGIVIWTAAIPAEPGMDAATPLTRRESEVMAWLRQGKTSPEIAVILACSTRTIEKHVANLYRKIGVRDRAAAMWCNS